MKYSKKDFDFFINKYKQNSKVVCKKTYDQNIIKNKIYEITYIGIIFDPELTVEMYQLASLELQIKTNDKYILFDIEKFIKYFDTIKENRLKKLNNLYE